MAVKCNYPDAGGSIYRDLLSFPVNQTFFQNIPGDASDTIAAGFGFAPCVVFWWRAKWAAIEKVRSHFEHLNLRALARAISVSPFGVEV